jgi:hypothetical protein
MTVQKPLLLFINMVAKKTAIEDEPFNYTWINGFSQKLHSVAI